LQYDAAFDEFTQTINLYANSSTWHNDEKFKDAYDQLVAIGAQIYNSPGFGLDDMTSTFPPVTITELWPRERLSDFKIDIGRTRMHVYGNIQGRGICVNVSIGERRWIIDVLEEYYYDQGSFVLDESESLMVYHLPMDEGETFSLRVGSDNVIFRMPGIYLKIDVYPIHNHIIKAGAVFKNTQPPKNCAQVLGMLLNFATTKLILL
jgi:hypothetical protein